MQKRFQQGKAHCPTTYFLGYDTDENGKLVINEEQAAIVRRIYREFLSGKGTKLIAKGLARDRIKTVRGNKTWTSNAIYLILTNEKYCGDILMQKTVTIDFLTHKRVPNEDIEPQYFIQDHHPAIIPKEEWYTVQEELKRRNEMFHDPDGKYRQKYSGRTPFSNALFCAECGRPVTRRRLTTKRNGEKFLFTAWQCRMASGREKGTKDCWARYIWEESLEQAFMEMLYQMKDNQEEVMEDARAAIELSSLSEIEEARIKDVEKQYNALSDRLNQLAGSNVGANADIYESTIQQLNYEQGILQTEWEQLMERKQKSISMERQLATLLDTLDELDDRQRNLDFRDDIFQQIVHRGMMHPDGRVDFQLKCGATIPAQAFVRATTWNRKAE